MAAVVHERDGSAAEPEAGSAAVAAVAAIAEQFACPACDSETLEEERGALHCGTCSARFPVLARNGQVMPWLFPDPGVARLEWKGRYLGFLQSNSLELERLRDARGNRSLPESGRSRIMSDRPRKRPQW